MIDTNQLLEAEAAYLKTNVVDAKVTVGGKPEAHMAYVSVLSALALTNVISAATTATEEHGKKLNTLTNRLVTATWALAAATLLLAVIEAVVKLTEH